jgi:hypothetical protein
LGNGILLITQDHIILKNMSDRKQIRGFNRRQFLRTIGIYGAAVTLAPGFNSFTSGFQSTGSPLYRNGVFIIDGKPVFLIAGSMDYFRIPSELWRARILQAKRGGINCIASCIAWNWHEPEESNFTFTGDHDLGRFIDICGELGMYFFARVGPFICDEWEGAGHPAWLIGKDNMQFRALHEPTMKYLRRWFEQLIPVIAKRQVTRGGPVILVQQENEYYFFNRSDGKNYQNTLIHWMRELGIDTTISDCNGFENRIAGSLQTLNGFGMGGVERFRKDRSDMPVLVSEHYTDYLDCWGWPDTAYPATDQVEQQSMEMLSVRVMYNYFMYNAGTNFGFMAATSWKTDDAFCTTTYYVGAPLAEGGALNPMFYATRSADILALNFQEFFCRSKMAASPLKSEGPVRVRALQSEEGTMIFVNPFEPTLVSQNYGTDGSLPIRWSKEHRPQEDIRKQPGAFLLPSGEKIEMAEGSANPMMVPFNFRISDKCKIDWANATLLGIAGSISKPTLVFRGDGSHTGSISVNGKPVKFEFGQKEPSLNESGNILILGLSRELANNAWFSEGRLIIGPAYVGERQGISHECWFNKPDTSVLVVEPDGSLKKTIIHTNLVQNNKLQLNGWKSYILPEINGGGKGWKSIEGPRSLEQIGAYYGYAWYCASYYSGEAQSTTLQFTLASDRFHVFQSGKACGVWGRGVNATRGPLNVELQKGKNDFVFLCDNMGRSSEGRANDRKGILGPVIIGSHKLDPGPPEKFSPDRPPSENYEFSTYSSFTGSGLSGWARDNKSGIGLSGFAWTLPHAPGERYIFALRWVPQYAWILINGKIIGEHGGDLSLVNGFSTKEFLLPEIEKNDPVRIELVVYGKELKNLEEHVSIYSYQSKSELSDWQYKLWETPSAEGVPDAGLPVWWECETARPEIPMPLFLYPIGMSKGQVYLNSKAVGRYWETGPQKTLYLPEPWWKEQNKLSIFDEHGRRPANVYLKRDQRAPINMILI